MFKVYEIFKSIEGEGVRAGLPCTFIRLDGCNLSCTYCDTQYSCTGNSPESRIMGIASIMEALTINKTRAVTLTGGEPLIHECIDVLIAHLLKANFEVNIETNGSVPLDPYVDLPNRENLIITMDYKSPSSGMASSMCKRNFGLLRSWDVVKFVVGDQKDLDHMALIIEAYVSNNKNMRPKMFVSPVFGKITPKEIVDFVLEHNLNDTRVQLQLHKIIWDPAKRGV